MRSVCRQSWIIAQIIAEVRLYRPCILVPFNVSFYERLQNQAFYFIIFAQSPFIADTLGTTSVVSLSSLLGNGMVNNNGYGKMTLLLNGNSVLTMYVKYVSVNHGQLQTAMAMQCLLEMIIIRDEFGVNSYRPSTPNGKNIWKCKMQ